MKKHCEIIEDLLPLYIDNVVKTETKTFVSDHLSECERCTQIEAELLQNKNYSPHVERKTPMQSSSEEMAFVKRVQKWKRRSGAFFLLLILLFSLIYWLVFNTTSQSQQDPDEKVDPQLALQWGETHEYFAIHK